MADSSRFWSGKHVVLSGASSGIGQALAELLATQGARLSLLARREELLAQVCGSLTERGSRATFRVADVTEREPLAEAIAQMECEHGPCDVAIANAGIYRLTHGASFDARLVADMMLTNVVGTANLLGAVLPGMVERRAGRLCAVASIAGMLGLPAAAGYSASKSAVITLLEGLRVDLAPLGLTVTAVCPGFVDTAMITDEERAKLAGIMPVDKAARKIAWAIERGRAEYWFPWSTYLAARVGRALPAWLYWRVMNWFPAMEEASSQR